jgi:hypothetical protein
MAKRFRTLGQIQKYIRVKEEPFDGTAARGANQQIQYNDNGIRAGIPNFTFDGTDLQITQDTKLKFGTNAISGSSEGIFLSGSKIQIDGTLEGASPLKIGGELQFTSTGSSGAFNFGPNNDAKIFYDDNDTLVVSGSSTGGLHLSGAVVHVEKHLAVGATSATHGITLPDRSDTSGKVKANAFVSYSSIRFKKNVEPLENAIDTLKKLNGVSYDWKDTDKKDYGFIAEEVGKVLPEIVEWSADPEYANSMDYIRIISFLVEGVKEQDEKITDLQNKLADMSKKIDEIKV